METPVLPEVILPSQESENIIQYEDFRKERSKQLKRAIFRAHV